MSIFQAIIASSVGSATPTISSVTATPNPVNEGSLITIAINYTRFTGQTVYYSFDYGSGVSSADFVGGPSGGSFTLSGSGTYDLSFTPNTVLTNDWSFGIKLGSTAGAYDYYDTGSSAFNVRYVLEIPVISSGFNLVNPPSDGRFLPWRDESSGVTANIINVTGNWGTTSTGSATGLIWDSSNYGYVEIEGTTATSTLTLSIVADFETVAGHWNSIYSGGGYGSNDIFAYIPLDNSTTINVGTGYQLLSPSSSINNRGLSWWDFVYDGNTVSTYQNGVQILSGSLTTPATGFTNPLWIGARYGATGDFLVGSIYQIKYAPVALSDYDIITQYNANTSTYGLTPITIPPLGLIFNGSSSDIRVSGNTSSWAIGDTWTIEAWTKASTSSTGTVFPILCQAPSTSSIDFGYINGHLIITNSEVFYPEPTPGVWTHVAVTSNAGYVTIYYNGVSQTTASVTNQCADTTNDLYVGTRGSSLSGQFFNGEIAGIRISNTVLYTGNFTPNTLPTDTTSTILLLNGNEPLIDQSYYELDGVPTSAYNGANLYISTSTAPNLNNQIIAGNIVTDANNLSNTSTVTGPVFLADPDNWGVPVANGFAASTVNFSGALHHTMAVDITLTTDYPAPLSTTTTFNSDFAAGIANSTVMWIEGENGNSTPPADLTNWTVTGPGITGSLTVTGPTTYPDPSGHPGVYYIPITPSFQQEMGVYTFTAPAVSP